MAKNDYHKTKDELIREMKALRREIRILQATDQSDPRTKKDLERVNRALKTLGACNEALVRAASISALLDEICQIIVGVGGYVLAWVGFAENDNNKSVRPVAQAGYEDGYLKSLNITWSDNKQGRGPTGTAIRSGKPVICKNNMTDPAFAPWKAEAQKRGYASGMALPLLQDGKAFGSLNIYAKEANAFDDPEVDLLVKLANNTAYGIASLRKHEIRLQAEQEVRNSEKRYRTLIEQASDGIFTFDLQGNYLDVNSNGCKLFKYSREEILQMNIRDVIFSEDLPDLLKNLAALRSGQRVVHERQIRCKDGSIQPVEIIAKMFTDGRCQAIITDITNRKRLEEELLKARNLESVGLLAGGIAHDFNNLLTGILGNISLTQTLVSANSAALERLTAAEKACFRARDLTQQLLTFSKGGAPIKEVASLANIIRESASFSLRSSNIHFEYSIPPDLWSVEVDPGQISQVINNLIINAIQASPNGGKIKITAKNILPETEKGIPFKGKKYVKVSVTDQGEGIPPDLLPKIFDPYFTTKSDGYGLGLATTYSIIRKHEGHITVDSKINGGTAFHFFLPAIVQKTPPMKENREKSIQKKGKILLMDDEEMIREVGGQMLIQLGYQVELASHGEEAVERYRMARSAGQPFDAVIMDLTIQGGMGGKETVQKLVQIDPSVRAIVSSGYSNDPVMANYKTYDFHAFIIKPYKLEDLEKVLHTVLKGTPPPRSF